MSSDGNKNTRSVRKRRRPSAGSVGAVQPPRSSSSRWEAVFPVIGKTAQIRTIWAMHKHEAQTYEWTEIPDQVSVDKPMGILCEQRSWHKAMVVLGLVATRAHSCAHDDMKRQAFLSDTAKWLPPSDVADLVFSYLHDRPWDVEQENDNETLDVKAEEVTWLKCTLVVVPHQLLPYWNELLKSDTKLTFRVLHWETQLADLTSDLASVVKTGADLGSLDRHYDHHQQQQQGQHDPLLRGRLLPKGEALVLCNANKFSQLAETCQSLSIGWTRVVFDEMGDFDVPRCPEMAFRFLWLLTDSLRHVASFRNLGFLRTLCHKLHLDEVRRMTFYGERSAPALTKLNRGHRSSGASTSASASANTRTSVPVGGFDPVRLCQDSCGSSSASSRSSQVLQDDHRCCCELVCIRPTETSLERLLRQLALPHGSSRSHPLFGEGVPWYNTNQEVLQTALFGSEAQLRSMVQKHITSYSRTKTPINLGRELSRTEIVWEFVRKTCPTSTRLYFMHLACREQRCARCSSPFGQAWDTMVMMIVPLSLPFCLDCGPEALKRVPNAVSNRQHCASLLQYAEELRQLARGETATREEIHRNDDDNNSNNSNSRHSDVPFGMWIETYLSEEGTPSSSSSSSSSSSLGGHNRWRSGRRHPRKDRRLTLHMAAQLHAQTSQESRISAPDEIGVLTQWLTDTDLPIGLRNDNVSCSYTFLPQEDLCALSRNLNAGRDETQQPHEPHSGLSCTSSSFVKQNRISNDDAEEYRLVGNNAHTVMHSALSRIQTCENLIRAELGKRQGRNAKCVLVFTRWLVADLQERLGRKKIPFRVVPAHAGRTGLLSTNEQLASGAIRVLIVTLPCSTGSGFDLRHVDSAILCESSWYHQNQNHGSYNYSLLPHFLRRTCVQRASGEPGANDLSAEDACPRRKLRVYCLL